MASFSLLRPSISPPITFSSPFSSPSSPRLSSIKFRSPIRKPSAIIATEISNPKTTTTKTSAAAPWLMLPPTFERGDMAYNFYSLTDKKVLNFSPTKYGYGGDTVVVGSSHGLLAVFDKCTHNLFLYNPVSDRRLGLPSIHTLSLKDLGLGPIDMCVEKLVTSPDGSRAMMIYGPGNRLAFCVPDHSTEWTPLGPLFLEKEKPCEKYGRVYNDIVYSKREKIFTCCTEHDMEEWDLRLSRVGLQVNSVYELEMELGPEEKKLVSWWSGMRDLVFGCSWEMHNYIVCAEHSNQYYVVHRFIIKERNQFLKNTSKYKFPVRAWDDSYPHKTVGFSVYKVAKVGRKIELEPLEGSMDNLVMFLGANHSFALRADDYPELKRGSIYFTDNPSDTPLDWQTYGAHDSGIYCYNDRTFHLLDLPNDVSSIKGIVPPMVWFTPSPY